jgi:hypothetical protein
MREFAGTFRLPCWWAYRNDNDLIYRLFQLDSMRLILKYENGIHYDCAS